MTRRIQIALILEATVLLLPTLAVVMQGFLMHAAFFVLAWFGDPGYDVDVWYVTKGVAPVCAGIIALYGLFRLVANTLSGSKFVFDWQFVCFAALGAYAVWYLFDLLGVGALVFVFPLTILLIHFTVIQMRIKQEGGGYN